MGVFLESFLEILPKMRFVFEKLKMLDIAFEKHVRKLKILEKMKQTEKLGIVCPKPSLLSPKRGVY